MTVRRLQTGARGIAGRSHGEDQRRTRLLPVGLAVSLGLHAAAAAALVLPWGGDDRAASVEVGAIIPVEVVALSGATERPAGRPARNPSDDEPSEIAEQQFAADSAQAEHAEAPQKPATLPQRKQPAAASDVRTQPIEQKGATAGPAGAQAVEPKPQSPAPDLPSKDLVADALADLPNGDRATPPLPPRTPETLAMRRNKAAPEHHPEDVGAGAETASQTPPRRVRQIASLPPGEQEAPSTKRASETATGGLGGSGAAPAAGNPAPEYPRRARMRGWEGRVVLAVLVGADGRPARVEVAESSGYAILDRAAQEAVAKWRFQPAKRDGQAVSADLHLPVRFKLTR